MNKTFRTRLFAILTFLLLTISITGCDGGSGSGTSITPPTSNPIHTTFNENKAYITQLGKSFVCSVTVSETRGDEITFSKMYTYRTFADSVNSGRTSNYYNGSPDRVYGWMFDIPGTMSPNFKNAFITNSTSLSVLNTRVLQPYERRTLSVNVMIGAENQEYPTGFNGFFIPYSDYQAWHIAGHTGVRYWVTLEGYDPKQDDTYNLHIPLEVDFPYDLSTDPYPVNPGNNDGTNPYNPIQ